MVLVFHPNEVGVFYGQGREHGSAHRRRAGPTGRADPAGPEHRALAGDPDHGGGHGGGDERRSRQAGRGRLRHGRPGHRRAGELRRVHHAEVRHSHRGAGPQERRADLRHHAAHPAQRGAAGAARHRRERRVHLRGRGPRHRGAGAVPAHRRHPPHGEVRWRAHEPGLPLCARAQGGHHLRHSGHPAPGPAGAGGDHTFRTWTTSCPGWRRRS